MWRSTLSPATLFPAIPMAWATSSCMTARRTRSSGSASLPTARKETAIRFPPRSVPMAAMWRLLFASNLVPGDTNGVSDIFVYDRQTHSIERVSLAADGTQGNGNSSAPRSVPTAAMWRSTLTPAISSPAIPMARGTSSWYDRQTDMIERVSIAADGTQGNGFRLLPALSADGRYVAFYSAASNLVPGDTNGVGDVFVTANPFAWSSRNHVVVLAAGQDVSGIDFGNHDIAPPTLSSLAPEDDATGVGVEPTS